MTGRLKQDITYLKQLRGMYCGKKFKDVMQIETQKLGQIRGCMRIIDTASAFMRREGAA